MTSPQVWEDNRFRQTGRTTRMLTAAICTAVFKQVIIIGADKRHVDELDRKWRELVTRMTYEMLGPTGRLNFSMIYGTLDCCSPAGAPTLNDGEPSFENERGQADVVALSQYI